MLEVQSVWLLLTDRCLPPLSLSLFLWIFVFTCREKVSCRSVSVRPAEESRISLERRILLEPWVGDSRIEKEREKRQKRKYQECRERKTGKITVSMPRPTPAGREQWTLINRTQRGKRGSKGGRERGRWNWLIGGNRGGKIKNRIKTA